MINGHGQSDSDIVPEKSLNNLREAEGMKGRSLPKGNVQQHPSHRTQIRTEGMRVGTGAHTSRRVQMQQYLLVITQGKSRMR
jgi:hypothetical protein